MELDLVESLSHEGRAPASQKSAVKPWQRKQWRIPEVSADFVAHVEDVPDLYAEPCDPQRPVVCFGETPPGCWPTPAHPGEARTS